MKTAQVYISSIFTQKKCLIWENENTCVIYPELVTLILISILMIIFEILLLNDLCLMT